MSTSIKFLFIVLGMLFIMPNSFGMSEITLPAGKRLANHDFLIKSIKKYSDVITLKPNDEYAYINRAYINYLLGNIDLALSDYDKLICLNPKNEEFYLNRGYLKHIVNRREDALSDYNKALEIKPNYAFAYNNIGVVLAELGKISQSMDAYDKAISINPNYAEAYFNRGNLKTKNNKNEDALKDFDTAIKLNPTDSASFNNRGVVKRKLNCNVGALSDFSIAIKLNPEDLTAYTNRGHLKKRYFDSEGAEEDFKTAVKLAESTPNIVERIETQRQLSMDKNSKKNVTPLVNNNSIAQKSASSPQKKESKKISQDSSNSYPANVAIKASVVKVDAHTKTNQLTQTSPINATPEIKTKPVANPEIAECYYIRGLQKFILQNLQGALSDFELAIKHNSQYAEAYYYRAAVKRNLKDESYIDDYKTAVTLNPSLKTITEANVLNILKI